MSQAKDQGIIYSPSSIKKKARDFEAHLVKVLKVYIFTCPNLISTCKEALI